MLNVNKGEVKKSIKNSYFGATGDLSNQWKSPLNFTAYRPTGSEPDRSALYYPMTPPIPISSKRLSTASVATYRIKNNLALMGQASNLSWQELNSSGKEIRSDRKMFRIQINLIEKFKTEQSPSWEKVGEMQTVLTQKAELPLKVAWLFCSEKK